MKRILTFLAIASLVGMTIFNAIWLYFLTLTGFKLAAKVLELSEILASYGWWV